MSLSGLVPGCSYFSPDYRVVELDDTAILSVRIVHNLVVSVNKHFLCLRAKYVNKVLICDQVVAKEAGLKALLCGVYGGRTHHIL